MPRSLSDIALAGFRGPCLIHGASQTPQLDRRRGSMLEELVPSLIRLADEGRCTRCAVNCIAAILAAHVRDLRAAKSNWSKEEKKALKMEIKGLMKSVKADVKKL